MVAGVVRGRRPRWRSRPWRCIREAAGGFRNALLDLHGHGGGHGGATHAAAPADETVVLPFEMATGHIIIQASVNDSRPLSFILDTGDKYGIIDADRAKELGLTLGSAIPIHGVGPRPASGARVEGAAFRVAGLPGFSQPVTLAMPLADIAARLGHPVDGIIGADFISEFIVEIDYERGSSHCTTSTRSPIADQEKCCRFD